jgi:hypothetical protein
LKILNIQVGTKYQILNLLLRTIESNKLPVESNEKYKMADTVAPWDMGLRCTLGTIPVCSYDNFNSKGIQ